MSLLPDPATLRAVANHIGAQADAARARASELDTARDAITWRGLAATAFAAFAAPLSGALRTSATDLDRAAHALRDHANSVEAVLSDLRRTVGDLAHTRDDILTALRDGADPMTLVDNPGVYLHDALHIGKDGYHLVKDGVDIASDAVGGAVGGVKDGLDALGSLVGI